MYEPYWRLTEPPFQNVPDPRFFCPLPAAENALEKLLYVVRYGKGGAVLTGDAGCGKTLLSRVLILQLEEHKYDVGLVINPAVPPDELLHEIALQLGVVVPPHRDRATLLRAVSDHLLANSQAGRATVLVLDEAHTIGDEATLEILRILMNVQLNDQQLLVVILLGAPALRDVIGRHASFRQRFALQVNLGPLSRDQTALYIRHRLEQAGVTTPVFAEEAVTVIAREARGLPRMINNLCDLCLFEGRKRQAREIDPGLVRVALEYL